MARNKSSANQNNIEQFYVDSIPPIIPRPRIENIILELISFFEQDDQVVILELPPPPKYFSTAIPPNYKPTEEEVRTVSTFAKKGKKSMFQYLANHPDLCRYAISQIPFRSFKSNKRKNFYYQLLQIAFYSDSLDLFKLTIVDTNAPPAKSSRKNRALPLIQFIDNPNKVPGLLLDPLFLVGSFKHNFNDIPTATSFAASPTELFIGKEGGLIRSCAFTQESMSSQHFCLFRPSVSNESYSLAWIKGYLWILTSTTIWQVNTLIPKVWTFINNKPKDLVPPMITDGQYFYCIRIKNRTPEIHVFSFNGTDFIHEKHIKLASQFTPLSEHKLVCATDGGVITFIIPKGKDSIFRVYSLATGKLLYEKSTDFTPTLCWCTRPFSNQHIVITQTHIDIYSKQLQLPRWLVGIPWPTQTDSNAIVNAIELATFHGVHFFTNGPCTDLGPLLSHYASTNNNVGFRMVAMILLHNQHDNIKPVLQTVVDYYTKSEDNPQIQRFCCFIFLACSSEYTVSIKPNILSNYLENDNNDLDFIFLYPNAFNFKQTSLSETAIKKLIVYVADRWNDFPDEASYIILSFLEDYVLLKIREEIYDMILEPISAIFRVIKKMVSLIFKNKYNVDVFLASAQYSAWVFLLRLIMNNNRSWSRYAHIFVKMLKLSFMDQNLEMKNCEKIREMLNHTLFLLLQIMQNMPMKLYNVQFQSVDTLYTKFTHPMNNEYPELDNSLLSVLNRAYDISTPFDYASIFFQIRRTVVFEYKADPQILNDIRVKSLSSRGLLNYLIQKDKDKNKLFPIQDTEILQWFFNEYGKAFNRLTSEQKVIMSLFFIQFNKRLNEYTTNIIKPDSWDFSTNYTFPFLFPACIFQQLTGKIPVGTVSSLKPEILAFSFNTLVHAYPQIDNSQHLLDSILRYLPPTTREPIYSSFASIEQEPKRYKSVLEWLIPVSSDFSLDFSLYSDAYKLYIWSGSPRIIESIMKGVVIAETKPNSNLHKFFKFIISLIKNYISRGRSYFVLQSEPSEMLVSLFIIIQYLKQMFNSETGYFRSYLENVAQKCSPGKAVAIFAILNNYLETIRKGVEVHFCSEEMIEVTGIIDDYYDNTIRVDGVEYNLSNCTKIWCKCKEKVHLSGYTNFSVYANLFETINFIPGKEDHLNVFKLVSLVTFLKHKKFMKLLSHSFKNSFTKMPSPAFFEPESVISDFFTFLSLNTITPRLPLVTFTNVNEPNIEERVNPILQNVIYPFKSEERANFSSTKAEGLLMTMENDGKFVSSPIHQLCHMKVSFILQPSEPNKQRPSFVLTVYGISRFGGIVLKSDSFKISSNASSSVLVELIFSPSTATFSIYIDRNLTCETAVSPSINVLYILAELIPMMMAEYKIQYDEDLTEVEEFPKCFQFEKSNVRLMKIARPPFIVPLSDSAIYNNCVLNQVSKYLVGCYTQFITMQILLFASKKQKPKPQLLMRILCTCNSFPNDETLDLNQFKISNIYNDLGTPFWQFAVHFLKKVENEDLKDFVKATENLIAPYTKHILSTSNMTTLFIRSKQTYSISNCYVFSSSLPPKTIGFSTDLFEFNSTCAIVPFSNFHGTIIDSLIYLRHLTALFVLANNYNFQPIYSIIDKLTENNPKIFKPLFEPLLELLQLISPSSQLRNEASFLFKECYIFKQPMNSFLNDLLPSFATKIITPIEMSDKLPCLNFCIQNCDIVYLTVNTTNELGIQLQISFKCVKPEADNGNMEMETKNIELKSDSNQFVVIENAEFSIVSIDPQFNNQEIKLKYYPIQSTFLPVRLDKWRPNHTHQIVCSVSPEQSLTPDSYSLMPLSTLFPFQVAAFVLYVIRNGKSSLFRFNAHLIKPIQQRTLLAFTQTGNMSTASSSSPQSAPNYQSMKQTTPLKSLLPNSIPQSTQSQQVMPMPQFRDDIYSPIEDSPLNFAYCSKVANNAKNSPQRIHYLAENKLSTQTMIDPDWIRINPEASQYPIAIRLLKQHFEKNIKYTQNAKTVAGWLQSYVQRMPNFALLMFIEYVIGKWGTRALQCDSPPCIYVTHVQTPEFIESIQNEHLIVIGKFPSEKSFRYNLMCTIQEFNDHLYNSSPV